MLKRINIGAFFLTIMLLGCSEHKTAGLLMMDDKEIKEELKVLTQERIFIGHQSVGSNILDGLREIINEYHSDSLHIQQLGKNNDARLPFLLESLIGENCRPKFKCSEYTRIVDELAPKGLTIAMMKFCFLDITHETDPNWVFDKYAVTVKSLQQKYPATIFVHVTVPLTTDPDIVLKVYRFIRGQSIDHDADNLAREQFNERVRKEFAKNLIFDLAAIESTHGDGTREIRKKTTGAFYSLAKEYASDEGHLNDYGKKLAARELIRTLAHIKLDQNIKK
jgi:hypothetical protein